MMHSNIVQHTGMKWWPEVAQWLAIIEGWGMEVHAEKLI